MAVINPPDQKETGKTHLSAVSGLLAILKCCLTLKKVDCTIVRTLWSPRCFVTHVNPIDRPTTVVIFFKGDIKPGSSRPVAKCGKVMESPSATIVSLEVLGPMMISGGTPIFTLILFETTGGMPFTAMQR